MSYPGKARWPELVGKNGEEAAAIIESENTDVHAQIVVVGKAVVIQDYRGGRVRVWVNDDNIVVTIPRIG